MKKTDLKDILNLVKAKLCQEPATACGLFWTDSDPNLKVDDHNTTLKYGVMEPKDDLIQVTTRYAVGEEDGGPTVEPTVRYGVYG